eukprot:UN04870
MKYLQRKKTTQLDCEICGKDSKCKTRSVYKTFPTDPNKPKKPISAYFCLQTITEIL